MDIAHELERSRLLGTTRPTDEEIIDALNEAENHECDDCDYAGRAARALDSCSAEEAQGRLENLLTACGLMFGDAVARRFVDIIKASVKTP